MVGTLILLYYCGATANIYIEKRKMVYRLVDSRNAEFVRSVSDVVS